MPDIVECDFITSFIIPSVQSDVEAVSWHIIHSPPAGSSAAPTVLEGNLPFQMLQLQIRNRGQKDPEKLQLQQFPASQQE